jgi:hypothetical protein
MDNLPPDTCKYEASGEDGLNHVDLFTDPEGKKRPRLAQRPSSEKPPNKAEPTPASEPPEPRDRFALRFLRVMGSYVTGKR